MRKLSEITTPLLPVAPAGRSFDRRPVASFFAGLTCLVLVRHDEKEKALLVSDDGDAVGAVWVPKAMLTLSPGDRGKFLVATVSKAFAGQKKLFGRFIDPERFLPEEVQQLTEAESLAARTRQGLRGDRAPMSWNHGRYVFA
jgi:hypothetical protein